MTYRFSASELIEHDAAIEARVRAELAGQINVLGATLDKLAERERGGLERIDPAAEAFRDAAALVRALAAGSSPDTTPERPKVKLLTSWMPFRFIDYDDAGEALADEIEAHREHQVAGAWSAFGWRELTCTTCDKTIWTVGGGVRLARATPREDS